MRFNSGVRPSAAPVCRDPSGATSAILIGELEDDLLGRLCPRLQTAITSTDSVATAAKAMLWQRVGFVLRAGGPACPPTPPSPDRDHNSSWSLRSSQPSAISKQAPPIQGRNRAFNQIGSVTIAKAVCTSIHQTNSAICRLQEQRSSIRPHQTAIKASSACSGLPLFQNPTVLRYTLSASLIWRSDGPSILV